MNDEADRALFFFFSSFPCPITLRFLSISGGKPAAGVAGAKKGARGENVTVIRNQAQRIPSGMLEAKKEP